MPIGFYVVLGALVLTGVIGSIIASLAFLSARDAGKRAAPKSAAASGPPGTAEPSKTVLVGGGKAIWRGE